MRKSLVALLLITSAAPVLAAPGDRDRDDRSERRATVERVRDSRADDDSDRRRKAVNLSSQPRQADAPRPRVDGERRAVQQNEPRRAPISRSVRQDEPRRAPVVSRPIQRQRDSARQERQADTVSTWRERERQRTVRPVVDRPERVVRDGTVGRAPATPITRPETRRPSVDLSQRTAANRWRNDWRRDSRYDWRSHRSRNRSLFRVGFYHDPFGYNYRRFGYGYQIYPAYYSSRYWLNDPFMYRLPPAWGPYRWVRYWDDAVLVDTRNGMVVDVLYGFFW
jgi:hypothetical protein